MNGSTAVASWKIGLAALLGAAVGSLAAHYLGPSRGPAAATITVTLSDDDKRALGALVREEVAQALGPRKGQSSAAKDGGPAQTPSPAAAEASKAARAAIEKQIVKGSWSDADSTQLRATMAPLSAEARVEIMRQLIVAINQRRVRFEGRGPLF